MAEQTARVIPTNEQYGAKFLRRDVARRVQQLRDLADRIEREAEADILRAEAGTGSYGRVAQNMLHEITSGLANLSLSRVVATATDADIAHVRGD